MAVMRGLHRSRRVGGSNDGVIFDVFDVRWDVLHLYLKVHFCEGDLFKKNLNGLCCGYTLTLLLSSGFLFYLKKKLECSDQCFAL